MAHIQTTTTDTIPPMMISPVLKNRLVNFNNLVITYLIAIYTHQIMAIHRRIHHQVDHVTLILRIIPILITTVEWNREWFVIQIKIRVNHHLQHNHPPKIRLISHQMRNLVEVKIFNTQINATPIRNHFKNNLSTSGTARIQNVSILITLNYFWSTTPANTKVDQNLYLFAFAGPSFEMKKGIGKSFGRITKHHWRKSFVQRGFEIENIQIIVDYGQKLDTWWCCWVFGRNSRRIQSNWSTTNL